MPKKTAKQRAHKHNKQEARLALARILPWLHIARGTIWKTIAVVGALVTLSGIFALQPKISVASAQPLDPKAPFSTPFIIANDGYFSLHDVTFRCVIRNAEDESHARIIIPKGIVPTGQVIPMIDSGEKSTVACPFPFTFNSPFLGADMDLVLKFRQDWFFWHQEKPFRFATAKNKEGQLVWLPRSMSE